MSEFYVICNYDGKVTLKVWYFTSVKKKNSMYQKKQKVPYIIVMCGLTREKLKKTT